MKKYVSLGSALLLLAIIAVAGTGWYVWQRFFDKTGIEYDNGTAVAKIVSERFERTASFKAATLSGEVQSTSSATRLNGLLITNQVMKAPYAIDYFVELRGLSIDKFRWDRATQSLTVQLPEVRAGEPRIEIDKMKSRTDGLWVSRGAGTEMVTKAAARAKILTIEAANKPVNMAKARDSARAGLENLLRLPLDAAKLNGNVTVRFPSDPVTNSRWDESRPLGEVLADAEAKRR